MPNSPWLLAGEQAETRESAGSAYLDPQVTGLSFCRIAIGTFHFPALPPHFDLASFFSFSYVSYTPLSPPQTAQPS